MTAPTVKTNGINFFQGMPQGVAPGQFVLIVLISLQVVVVVVGLYPMTTCIHVSASHCPRYSQHKTP